MTIYEIKLNKRKNKPHTRPNRKPVLPGGHHRVDIYLDENCVKIAKELGEGNMSAGVRRAIYLAQIELKTTVA